MKYTFYHKQIKDIEITVTANSPRDAYTLIKLLVRNPCDFKFNE